jgi:YihY family inner membrane protein
MPEHELVPIDAGETLRRYGRWALARESFRRFRLGDGFTSARGLGLQLALALIPFLIFVVAVGAATGDDRIGEVIRRTLLSLAPGVYSDDVVQKTFEGTERLPSNGGQLAIWLGLALSMLSLTVALGQVERGANRIYGIQRDRPTPDKYARAAVMGLLTGIPGIIGLMLLLAGGAAAAAIHDVYNLDPLWLQMARWPVGAALTLLSLISIFNRSPRRRQPSWEWLAVGAAVALFLWLLFTALLVLYLRYSPSFGAIYGPLTAVIALLLWTTLTSVAVFLGLAVAAQLEAIRAGITSGAPDDPELIRTTKPGSLPPHFVTARIQGWNGNSAS